MRIALNKITASETYRRVVAPIGLVALTYIVIPIAVAVIAICSAAAVVITSAGTNSYFSPPFQKYLSQLEVFAGELALLTISGILAAVIWSRRTQDLRIFVKKHWWVDVLLGVIVATTLHYIVRKLLLPWLYLAMPVGAEWTKREYQPIMGYGASSVTAIAGTFFLAGLYKPLVETVIFVGLLYRKLRSAWGITASVLIASILFAVVHQNTVLFLDFFFFGLANFVLFELRKSLAAPLFCHVTFNTLIYGSQLALFSGIQSQ